MTNPTPPIPESYWVIPGALLAGEYPGAATDEAARAKIEALLAAGVDHFIDLTCPGELRPYAPLLQACAAERGLTVRHERFAIQDVSIPDAATMAAILEALAATLARGGLAYVHCWGGVGRTGTVVGCHLVRGGASGDEALRQLAEWWETVPKRSRHPRSPETEQQRRFVRQWREPGER